MATNKPPSRKTHITRIFGTNKNGDRLTDIYADMERIDSAESAMQVPPKDQWQKLKRKFRWCDDPDKEDYNPKGNPSRKTEVIKVCDPESTDDVNDPEEWIPIRVIKQVKAVIGGTQANGQQSVDQFLNKAINEEIRTGRKVKVRRIVHYDTNIDDQAQAAADADPNRLEFVISSDDYTRNLESKDEAQYIEYEIVTEVSHTGNSQHVKNQRRRTKLLNDYLIEESEPATLKIRGEGDINPPYRLDPYQNIVNISFQSSEVALLGSYPFAGPNVTATQSSRDGETWDTKEFGANTSNATTGLGKTVVCAESEFVAFGKPRDGDACFIAVNGKTVQRGVLNNQGDLIWSTVAELNTDPDPSYFGGGRSCKFCGGAFFITYAPGGPDGSDDVFIAVSFSGTGFTQGIKPFNGVSAEAIGTGIDPGSVSAQPTIGSVAFDPDNERYVVTGTYERSYLGTFRHEPYPGAPEEEYSYGAGDHNFMSAVSGDGLTWTPTFDRSEGAGDRGSVGPSTIWGADERASTIAFGNGVFVAATGYKTRFKPDNSEITDCAPACGVATSTNGSGWTNRLLPGIPATGEGSRSTSESVVFVKSRKVINPDSDGFFVVTGHRTGSGAADHLWISEDGVTWRHVQSSSRYGWILSTFKSSKGTVIYK